LNASNLDARFNQTKALSFWLSQSSFINPGSNNRFVFQPGVSATSSDKKFNYWNYPNIDFGLKVSRNLALTTKIFGYNSGAISPQILGGGVQYFFGTDDTLQWVSSLQRVDSKFMKYFSMSSLTLDICKWIPYQILLLRLGSGTSFYKKINYSQLSNHPSRTIGKTNFIFIGLLIPQGGFNYVLEGRFSNTRIFYSIFIQKEFF